MKSIALALSALLLGTNLACSIPANADPFAEDDSHHFNDRHRDFMDSLGDAGERMRHDHDYANVQTSQRHQADQQSIQDGTQAVSRQAFEQSQIQALQSGGLYNGNSSYGVNGIGGPYGMGFGGFGIGSFGIGSGNTTLNSGIQPSGSLPAANTEAVPSSNGNIAPPAVTDHFSKDHFTGASHHDWSPASARSSENLYYKTSNGMNRIRRHNADPLKGGSFQLPARSERQVSNSSHLEKGADTVVAPAPAKN